MDGDPAGLRELRSEALSLVTVAVAALTVAGYYGLVFATNRLEVSQFGYTAVALAAPGLAWWARRLGPAVAATILVVGLLAVLGAGIIALGAGLLAFWLLPIVLLGGVLVGWPCAVATAAVGSALIAGARLWSGAVAGEVAAQAIALAWVGCLLCWLLAHPTRAALDWAWHSYTDLMLKTEELRDRQAELGRVVKSLGEAYVQLERLNADLARAREAAEQARRLKAEFAAAISHELRTPLNLIIGFSEMMVGAPRAYGGQPLPEALRGDLEAIYRNACHLSGLVDDVLDLSQIEAERMGLHKERLRLAAVIDEAATTVGRLFAGKGLSLRLEVPYELPLVYADRTRIRQVVINLLSNAARFTDAGGVTVRAWPSEGDLVVAVRDTGVGIPPEQLAEVFEQFRRIEVLGERRLAGSGLGLTISKRFIELHGGAMWVESQPGQGSAFYFSLPSCESVIAQPASSAGARWLPAPSPAEPDAASLVVLDPDGDTARLLARHLDGYRVLGVAEARQVPRLVAETHARAVVVACGDGATGWLAAPRPGEAAPDVPVITCTLRTGRVAARELGVADYLIKPVSRDQVRVALRRLGKQVRTVLVVDDDAEMRRLLTRMVRSASRQYTVLEARGGLEAVSTVESQRPDAVLLDLVMPDLGGDEVLRRIRGHPTRGDTPVILVTARGLSEEGVTAEMIGITRPGGLSVRELTRCLRSSLAAIAGER